ncbi:MAG: sigma-70 family RNA polymerase sigma factor [Defluviitaleaceae bacterium]|nr:sigma-70 family RNA polymerase sigma factor [Defluviitaleaceae bacterium]
MTNIENITAADLVDNYGEAVYRLCRSLTPTKEDAEDLFQDTYVKALGQMPERHENTRGLLFSTAIYLWKSRKRTFARRARLAPVAHSDELLTASSGFNIESNLIAREEIRTLREEVAALPEKFRIPVILYYTVELSISDIASTLSLPEGTVKSRLHKARKLIKEGLINNGYEQ